MPGAFEAMDIGKHWRSTGTSVRVCLNEEPFYRNNPTNYQAAMDRFMNIIKHVGPHIHVFNVHTNDHKQLAGYNLYTHERLDGTELKVLSSNVVETILIACSSLQELSIESTKFIDCKENEPSQNTLKTIDILRSSQFANGFLTRLSARVPNLQEVKLKIHKKEIISGGDELYDIVMPYTHLKTLKVDIKFGRNDDSSRTDEDVNVRLVINKHNNNDNNSAAETFPQYYHCFVSAAGSNSTITHTTHQLDLKHVCNPSCQHSDTEIMISSSQTCYNFCIQGSSFHTLKLNAGSSKGFNNVLHSIPSQ